MEIEDNEYIRTESGIIEKIKTFDEQTNIFKDKKGKLQKWLGETVFGDPYCEEILKHSKNIIDLIEVGDIIEIQTGLYSIYKINIEDEDTLISAKESLKGWTLKSILTKEQYEQNSYKL